MSSSRHGILYLTIILLQALAPRMVPRLALGLLLAHKGERLDYRIYFIHNSLFVSNLCVD